MSRSIAAVLAGYLVFAVTAVLLFRLAHQDPHGPVELRFGALSTLYGAFFAALGGYLAGWIAGRRPFTHGCVVGAAIALGAAATLIAQPGAAIWSELAALLVMAPMAALGGFLRAFGRHPRKTPPS